MFTDTEEITNDRASCEGKTDGYIAGTLIAAWIATVAQCQRLVPICCLVHVPFGDSRLTMLRNSNQAAAGYPFHIGLRSTLYSVWRRLVSDNDTLFHARIDPETEGYRKGLVVSVVTRNEMGQMTTAFQIGFWPCAEAKNNTRKNCGVDSKILAFVKHVESTIVLLAPISERLCHTHVLISHSAMKEKALDGLLVGRQAKMKRTEMATIALSCCEIKTWIVAS